MEPKFTTTMQVKVAEAGASDYDIEPVCSTEAIDRSGEVVVQAGWKLDNFRKAPVFLAAHKHQTADGRSTVIGSFKSIGVETDGLVGRVKFADTDLGKEYKSLFRDGHMRGVSVGFMPLKGEHRTIDGKSVYFHLEQELYEVSAVPVGCNPEALARLRKLGVEYPEAQTKEQPEILAKADDLAGQMKRFAGELQELADQVQRLMSLILDGFDEIKAILPDQVNPEHSSDAGSDELGDRPAGEGVGKSGPVADSLKGLLDKCS